MTLCIMKTRENLKRNKDVTGMKTLAKPSGIWRKTGYLDSCL